MDQTWFRIALQTELSGDGKPLGIGTLGEKTVHAVLKRYYEPDPALHEIKCGDFVADILSDGRIFEIQSRGFERLIPKLTFFLEKCDVTVVYPVAVRKEIVWIDPETGECQKPRVSNKHGNALDVFAELYRIRSFLRHPHLHIRAVLMNVIEYRLKDGRGRDGKKHATKEKLIPTALLREICIDRREDYFVFLPQALPRTFTADTLAQLSGASQRSAGMALRVLRELGLTEIVGKEKRKNLYSVVL